CTHQSPLSANSTMRLPADAPLTRPSITSNLSGLPSPAGGTRVNSIVGSEAAIVDRQLVRQVIPVASRRIDAVFNLETKLRIPRNTTLIRFGPGELDSLVL